MRIGPVVLIGAQWDDVGFALSAMAEADLENHVLVILDKSEAIDFLQACFSDSNRAQPALVIIDIDAFAAESDSILQVVTDESHPALPVVLIGSDPSSCMRTGQLERCHIIEKPLTLDKLQLAARAVGQGLYFKGSKLRVTSGNTATSSAP